uniref:Uncharacterized protein n=1 Tax=Clytia hemisphaerica TaxID=252671 RepID=A0A7M5XDW8_9CNID
MKNPDPIYLRCIVDAVPPAVFKWSDPKGNQVSEEPTYIIQDPDEDKYFGTYTCRASNIVHFSDHTVEVIKIGNPEQVTLTTKTVNARTATFDMKIPTDTGKSELKDTIKIVYQDTKTGLIQQKVLIGLGRSTIQLDKLTPYTDYDLNVTVENEYFSSTGQKLAFKTLEAVPGIPSNITIDSTVSSITINWQPPTNPNGVITKFIYKFYKNIDPINDTEIEVSSSVLNKTFNNLGTAYQQYAFRIRAVNKAGEGDWTPVLTRYTDPEPPSSPRNLTVTTSIQLQKHYLNINWKPPIKGSNTITKYEIKINTTSLEDNSNLQPFTHTANAKSIPQRNYKIATKPYSKAFVWVREGGGDKPVWGSFAGPFEVTTPQGVPTPPLKLVVLGTTSDKVHLRWNKPQKINGVLHKFTIEYRKKNTNDRKQQYLARQLDTNTTFFHTLDGLESLSPYYVNVYAHSRSGDRSNSSNVVTALTEVALAPVAPRQTADEESNLTPIIGGVVAFVFLLAVAIAVFLYMSKRRSRLKSASSANSDSQFFKLNDRETKAPPLDVTDGSTMNLSVVSNFGNEYGKDSERCFKLLRPIQLTDLKERIIFQTSNNNKGFIDEFRSIKVEADLTYEVSTKPENKVKNRYANILAYDHSRVVLNNVENLDDSDYINANYIDGFDRSSKFIATQGITNFFI